MKETKWIIIILSILTIILIFVENFSITMTEILHSLITGFIATIVVTIIQYLSYRNQIKNLIFESYYDFYLKIYAQSRKKKLFYNTKEIYKQIFIFSKEFSDALSQYDSFIPKFLNPFYKKINPPSSELFDLFKLEKVKRLSLSFVSHKTFYKIAIPIQECLEKILIEIDKNKFKRKLFIYNETIKKIEDD